MDIADSCFTMIMECHLWQCTGNTALIIWSADTMTFTGCRCKHYTSCMPTHLLLKYGKIGNESQDIIVPHGAFGYKCYNECVHAYRI